METSNLETASFSIRQAKELIKDLHKPNPKIYWTDFLLTILSGHALFTLNVHTDKWLDTGIVGLVAAKTLIGAATVVLFLRAAMFTHELVHLPKEGWTSFRVVWNILCGIPFMIPSFTYYPHIDHHRRKSYGTDEDAEYLNLSHQPPRAIVWYMLGTLITPFVGIIRWGILTPVAWVFPQIRRWTFARASTMVMDISYVRPEAGEKVYRIARMQEVACLAVAWFMILHGPLIAKTWLDPFWFHAYAVSVAMIVLNNVRTLGAHRWTGKGAELTFEQQLLDSCDYPYNPMITELWGPTGTRYHATHHLFPSLPYHNLGKAHRRLMAGLPADSIYRETVKRSLIAEIIELWKRSSAAYASIKSATILELPRSRAA